MKGRGASSDVLVCDVRVKVNMQDFGRLGGEGVWRVNGRRSMSMWGTIEKRYSAD